MHTLSAIEIRDKFLNGELTALAITDHFLDRIKSMIAKSAPFLQSSKNALGERPKPSTKSGAKGTSLEN